MNDWQDIIGGTWYSSSPALLNRNHRYHNHSRRLVERSQHRNRNSQHAGGYAAGSSTNTRRVRNAAPVFSKKWLLFFLVHLGCLAVDHSTRELSYEEDEIRLIVGSHQSNSDSSIKILYNESQPISSDSSILTFHPKTLDFQESPVGVPRLGVVLVENRLNDENVKLISISANTINFQSSFFAIKNIPPGGNTSFEIVFLSRKEGLIDSSLYIHTSKGLFKYALQGHGLPNPYRLRPLVGAIIPLNGTYEPIITIHNPHNKTIQIIEMLSSDGDFHLSLPDGVPGEEGEGIAWEILPYQTKSLMKGSFVGTSEGNHTGYIKIRVNSSSPKVSPDYLLLPVEVQVSSKPAVYSPHDCLDFGLMVKTDKPKTMTLSLINSHLLPVNVQSIAVKGGLNSAVKIEFRPLNLEPDASLSTVVALVTFDPSKVNSKRDGHGFIEIRCDSGDSLSVPFRSNVLQGKLVFNSSSLGFFIKANHILPRNFSVLNKFNSPIAIYEAVVSHPEIFGIENFNRTEIISQGEQKNLFSIRVHKKNELCESHKQVHITLKSNITNLKLPLTCYDGKLNLHTMEQQKVKFGRIEPQSTHIEYFSVDNDNPVEVRLKSWSTNCTSCHIELVGMQKGRKEDLARIQDFDGLTKSLFLQPKHVAIFSIEIRRPSVEGDFWAEAIMMTDHNQTIRVPFQFSVREGAIRADVLTFDKAFPGKISYEKLHLTSTFNVTMNVKGVEPSSAPYVWFTASSKQQYPEVLPIGKNYVGKINFDPQKLCGCDCYSGFNTDSTIGKSWVSGMNVSWDTGENDFKILQKLQRRYDLVKNTSFSNISLWLETTSLATQGTGFKIKTLVTFTWPRLTQSKSVNFPLTSLGNETYAEITVANPSSSPLIVQALLANDYGPLWSQFVQGQSPNGNITIGNSVFFIDGVGTSSQANESYCQFGQIQRQAVTELLNFTKDPPGVVFMIPTGAKFHIRVKFKPNSKEIAATLLLLRNNLTGIETVWLRGRAGIGLMTVGNGAPGSSLHFHITERLLQGCYQRETARTYVQPQLTVRRTFVARNVGEIPLDITMIEVYPHQNWLYWIGRATMNGESCEGYGFRILNCQSFTLLPNQTHILDIAFSPDFTMTKIIRTLRLTDTTGIFFNYTLIAMVPSDMLKTCSDAIARPSWEPTLKGVIATGIIVGLVIAAMMAYCEATNIISQAVVATLRVLSPDEQGEALKDTYKLDLKSVYDKVDNRFKRNQCHQQSSPKEPKNNASPVCLSAVAAEQTPSPTTATAGSSVTATTIPCAVPVASTSNGVGATITNNNNTVKNRKKKKEKEKDSHNNNTTEVNLNHSEQNKAANKPEKESSKAKTTPVETNNSKAAPPVASSEATSPPIITNTYATSGTTSNHGKGGSNLHLSKRKKKNQKKNVLSSSSALPLSNGTSSPTPKDKEETSSTTTESSNSEDLTDIPMDNGGKTKERQLSGKSSGSEPSSCAGINEKKNKKGRANNSNGRKNSKTNLDNSTVEAAIKKTEDLSNTGRKQKKKELSGSSSGSGSRGSTSPKQEFSSWDITRQLTGDSFGDLSTSNEPFITQKSGKRSNYSHNNDSTSSNQFITVGRKSPHGSGKKSPGTGAHKSSPTFAPKAQVPPGFKSSTSLGYQYSTPKPLLNHAGITQLNSSSIDYQSGQGNMRSLQPQQRVPGVIGQHRHSTNHANVNSSSPPPSQASSFVSNALATTLALSLTNSNSSSSGRQQHGPPARTLSNPSCAWVNDVEPDADMWKRRMIDMNNCSPNASIPTLPASSTRTTNSSLMDLNTGGHIQSKLSPHASYFSPSGSTGFSTPSTMNVNQASTSTTHNSLNRTSPKSCDTSPYSYPLNAMAESIFSMIPPSAYWQTQGPQALNGYTNNLYTAAMAANAATTSANGNSQRFSPTSTNSNLYSMSGQSGSTFTQPKNTHGYVQRLRSEPLNRPVTTTSESMYYGGLPDNQSLMNGHLIRQQDRSWPPTTSTQSNLTNMTLPQYNYPATSAIVDSFEGESDPNSEGIFSNSTIGGQSKASTMLSSIPATLGSSITNASSLMNDWNALVHDDLMPLSDPAWAPPENMTWSTRVNRERIASGSLAVGGNRTRLDSTPPSTPATTTTNPSGFGFSDIHSRAPHDVAQSQREVEAGLGFNPFVTDIWRNNKDDEELEWTPSKYYGSNRRTD